MAEAYTWPAEGEPGLEFRGRLTYISGMLPMRKKPPEGMPNIHSGEPGADMNLFHLRNSLERGRSIEELADFLCRDVEEVETRPRFAG
jgi:hypothetical protein